MASFLYNRAAHEIASGTLNLTTSTLKLMLVRAAYVADRDHDVVDNGANNSTDPSFNEVTATNYTGGFGGAGRKTATLSFQEDDTNDRAIVALNDVTWTALGGALNDTVAAAILIKEITDDTLSRLVAYFDITDTPTNGSDFTLDFATLGAGGNIRFTT